jgi:hypothetical protein
MTAHEELERWKERLEGKYLVINTKILRIEDVRLTDAPFAGGGVYYKAYPIQPSGERAGEARQYYMTKAEFQQYNTTTPMELEEARAIRVGRLQTQLEKSRKAIRSMEREVLAWGGALHPEEERQAAAEKEREARIAGIEASREALRDGVEEMARELRKLRRLLVEELGDRSTPARVL